MKTLTATQARKDIYNLIDKTAETHEPIQIVGKRTNAVLINESDWMAIQETLYLSAIPYMSDSIKEGLATSIEDCSTELDW
jgi:PHD/YefM family antitoxin component YafN of YafNO toxin-antitoxin module